MNSGFVEDAGGFCDVCMSEAIFVPAPLEFCACYSVVIAVTCSSSFAAFVENGNIAIVCIKVPMLSEEVLDKAGRMHVCQASGQSCFIGKSTDVEGLSTCLDATLIILLDRPMMGSLSVGLLKRLMIPESKRAVLIIWET